MLVPPNIHKYRDSSDCINRQTKSPTQLLTNTIRFNELQQLLGSITTKTLTEQLRELEEQGIILRTVYPEVPPRVKYSLSEIGCTLKPILGELCEWGKTYQKYKSY